MNRWALNHNEVDKQKQVLGLLQEEGMRAFAIMWLTVALTASPLLASDAKEASKDETTATVTSTSAVPDKPTPAIKVESSAIESEVQDLRSLVEEQRAELEAQRAAL